MPLGSSDLSTRLSEAAKDQDQLEDGQRKLDNG
jgi:hypothetical protein